MIASRRGEQGIVLVIVLVILAIAAGVVVLMLNSQDRSLHRARLAANIAQAEALARGAETSVLVALRRDMIAHPEADHMTEPWAQSLQSEVTLETGRFSVAVADANARFDINRLAGQTLTDTQAFVRLAGLAGLTADATDRITAGMSRSGPVEDLADLARFGVDATQIAALRPHATVLPIEGRVNLNTADHMVLAALLGDPGVAGRLLRTRQKTGQLTDSDLAGAGVSRPPASGFTSDVWDITAVAEVDDAVAELHSRLLRRRGVGTNDVVVIRRRFGALPGDRPPPPEGLD